MNPTCDPEELREQIQRVLNEIQDCIREGRFTIFSRLKAHDFSHWDESRLLQRRFNKRLLFF